MMTVTKTHDIHAEEQPISNEPGTTGARASRALRDEEKRYFDATKTLRDLAWESFDRRRGFEWKLSFGLWTALGALLGSLAAGKVILSETGERIVVSVACVFVIVLHSWWSVALAASNRADLKKSYIIEKELRETLGLTADCEAGRQLDAVVNRMGNRSGIAGNWGHLTQVLITLTLAGSVVVTTWIRG